MSRKPSAPSEIRIVRTKSIPRVETERLVFDAGRICALIHPGSSWGAGPRREMINYGMKLVKIHAELRQRGVDFICCDVMARLAIRGQGAVVEPPRLGVVAPGLAPVVLDEDDECRHRVPG